MFGEVIQGVWIPFLGTTMGAACVLFLKNTLNEMVRRAFIGFAAGVMVAASIWSLLIPAMEQSAAMGKCSFVPAVIGFWAGILFLLVLDLTVPHLHKDGNEPEGPRAALKKTTMLILAVTLHNIPEGMAVGAVFAGCMSGNDAITTAGAMTLAVGMAIQNFPEGAIVSMPLHAEGMKKWNAFLWGALSGAVEPLAAILTILASGFFVPILPYLLSFAAGAMIYVVVEELIPETSQGEHSNLGTLFFALGFTLMLSLDVGLG